MYCTCTCSSVLRSNGYLKQSYRLVTGYDTPSEEEDCSSSDESSELDCGRYSISPITEECTSESSSSEGENT